MTQCVILQKTVLHVHLWIVLNHTPMIITRAEELKVSLVLFNHQQEQDHVGDTVILDLPTYIDFLEFCDGRPWV